MSSLSRVDVQMQERKKSCPPSLIFNHLFRWSLHLVSTFELSSLGSGLPIVTSASRSDPSIHPQRSSILEEQNHIFEVNWWVSWHLTHNVLITFTIDKRSETCTRNRIESYSFHPLDHEQSANIICFRFSALTCFPNNSYHSMATEQRAQSSLETCCSMSCIVTVLMSGAGFCQNEWQPPN
jgi:hypothetical protein